MPAHVVYKCDAEGCKHTTRVKLTEARTSRTSRIDPQFYVPKGWLRPEIKGRWIGDSLLCPECTKKWNQIVETLRLAELTQRGQFFR